MTQVDEILDRCVAFDRRGPFTSLTGLTDNTVVVLRDKTEWSSTTMGKPLEDKRNPNLSDLFPSPRSVLKQMFDNLERNAAAAPSPRYPGMR